jgi:hypothetical protein
LLKEKSYPAQVPQKPQRLKSNIIKKSTDPPFPKLTKIPSQAQKFLTKKSSLFITHFFLSKK